MSRILKDRSAMNEAIRSIMANSGCPLCRSKITRDVGKQYFGIRDLSAIVWKCSNSECKASKQWNRAGEFRRAQ